MAKSWSVFGQFRAPGHVWSWSSSMQWCRNSDRQYAARRERLAELRTVWDSALRDIGGDPSTKDWAEFRPLCPKREENWSDWLAQLIEDSNGEFNRSLFSTGSNHDPLPVVWSAVGATRSAAGDER